MASQKKIIEMIASVKAIYPYYAKDADIEMTVKTWKVLLKNIPDDVTEVAFYKALQTCKMPPTPADILEEVKGLINANEPTDEELWGVFLKVLPKVSELRYMFRFTAMQSNGKTQGDNARDKAEQIWQDLPEKLKQYVGSKGELMRLAEYTDDELKYEKNRFMKSMPVIQKRQEYAELVSGNDLMIDGAAIGGLLNG
jgi:hypothetical protein